MAEITESGMYGCQECGYEDDYDFDICLQCGFDTRAGKDFDDDNDDMKLEVSENGDEND